MDEFTFDTIKKITFGIYTNEEIENLSVLNVDNIEILDVLGHPAPRGLHDLKFGPNEKDDFCDTCGLNFYMCPGHVGHITLPVPVYNPLFFKHLHKLLRGICFGCHRLLAPPVQIYLALYQLKALEYGLVNVVQEMAEIVTDTSNESISYLDLAMAIQSKLSKKFEEAVKEPNVTKMKESIKSVVECRKNIVNNFMSKYMMKVTGKCPHCKMPPKKIMSYKMKFVWVDSAPKNSVGSGDAQDENSSVYFNKDILPEQARTHLKSLWENEKIFLQCLFKILYMDENCRELSINKFFMDKIIVPPSRFRRLSVIKGRKYIDSQTAMLNGVLKDCQLIQNILQVKENLPVDQAIKDVITKLSGKNIDEKFRNLYAQLQIHINEIYDSSTNKERSKFTNGIKQILEKKEGLFRMNMMGKRVNYVARSVISPDPYIHVNEIGVPMVFAKNLTYPEPVNYWNIEKLRLAVMNGPNVHPGAILVKYEDGRVILLPENDAIFRQAVANTLLTPPCSQDLMVQTNAKIVHRHLKNGDMLLLNRQPTLHKPSIMAHKARVLPAEKTLRLHYANCKSYNADFDGDEMNAHVPQSYLAVSECRDIVNVDHQYLVPKDGTPLSGLIQDHIIAGILLTMRGQFFTKDDYHQLLHSALYFLPTRLKFLPPAILKPQRLWSGKQIISSVIINLVPKGKKPPTLQGKAKVAGKNWKNAPERVWAAGGTSLEGDNMSESEVIIRDGELLCGVIDKAQVGPTPYSLIHVCYELYGGKTSSTLLTSFARLFTCYLQYYAGFSFGVEDIVVTKKANKRRKKILKTADQSGLEATAKALDIEDLENINMEELLKKYKDAHHCKDDFELKMVDMEMKKVTQDLSNNIKDVCVPSGLIKKFPKNNLQLMIESGAKGSSVNAVQISCLLGQIELEGRRMPLMLNGSALPSFTAYDTSPAAGGFISGRFLTGINPQEYYFHCMAGREGLIDTAVKTSSSGYLQRCLIKHLEGITVNYDMTVRDSDGSVIQFLYGEDGLDILKMQMLKENRLHLLAQNHASALNQDYVQMCQLTDDNNLNLSKAKKKIKKWNKKHPIDGGRSALIKEVPATNLRQRLKVLKNMTDEMSEKDKKKYKKSKERCPEPVISKHRPDLVYGSVSEHMEEIISNYVSKSLKSPPLAHCNDITPENFRNMCYYRAMKSLAEPGEAVGILAAQSIGEPSTQMTLNTFHFAGKGEMNVTLGIPRIREIIMTASQNISTPTMDLPLLDKPGIEKKAEKLKLKLNPVRLKEVLEGIKIKEYLSIHKFERMNYRNYIIRLNFLEHSVYKGLVNTTPAKILYYVEHVFIKRLIEAIKKKRKLSLSAKIVEVHKNTEFINHFNKSENDVDSGPVDDSKADDGDSSGAEDADDGDATSAKSKMRHNQDMEYEDPEDGEMEPESDNDSEKEEAVTIKEDLHSSNEEENVDELVMAAMRKQKRKCISDMDKALRINGVKCLNSWISSYDFDVMKETWCEISLQFILDANRIDMKTLLEDEVGKAFVYSVPHIKEALLVKNPDSKSACKMMLKTSGVNFLEIFKHVDILDINKVYSNNIHAIAEIYGIEAAAKAIKREIANVFKPYGIEVDTRHLSLISDYMTSSGYYRPCNRLGMDGNASPLQQMTFETTMKFMVDSMSVGIDEHLKSPSANIIAGKFSRTGTGCFDIRSRMGKYE